MLRPSFSLQGAISFHMRPIARKEQILVQDAGEETLIYDLSAAKAFCLNKTSAMVWRLCDGRSQLGEITEKMTRQLNSAVCDDMVWLALYQLKKEGLLENGEDLADRFAGMSRREMIGTVGMSSAAALPIVASVIAPQASDAASLIPNGDPCTIATQCKSNCCGPTFPGNAPVCLISGISTGFGCGSGLGCQCLSMNCSPTHICL